MALNGALGSASTKFVPDLKSALPQGAQGIISRLVPITTDTTIAITAAGVSDLPRVVQQGISQALSDVQALAHRIFPPFGVNTNDPVYP